MPAVAVAQIPQDVSWAAFVKLCNLVDVSQAMRALDLLRVKKVKMVAIKPYLQKVSDDVNLAGLESTDLPFPEFIVGNKLVAWVKQFTTVEVTKQQKSIQKPLVSKSLSPTSLSPVAQKTPLPLLQQQPPPVAAGPKDDSKQQQQQQQQGAQGRYKVKGMENIVSKGKSKAKANADGDKRVVALTHLPATRNKIPKVDLQIVPFYSEVVDNIHANPVMIALLSTNPVKPNLDRLSIKVYDIITSVECIVNVNMREYTLFQKELDQQLHDEACQFFEPTDPQWWVRNVSKILIVQGRVHNKLYVIISKKSIESLVVEAIKDREAQESVRPGPIELQESLPSSVNIQSRDGSVRSDNYEEPFDVDSIQSEIGNATLVSADAHRDIDMKRASSDEDKGLLCRSSTSAVDTPSDEQELNAAASVPSTSVVEDREQGPKQLASTYVAVDEMLTDPYLASAAADDDEEEDDLYGHDFVSDEIIDEPLPVNCTPAVEDVRGNTDELVGLGPTPVFAREEEEEEAQVATAAAAAMVHSLGIEQQQQPPEEHTTSSQQLYSDTINCDPDIEDSHREEYEEITSSVMLDAMGSLLNNEASGSSSHNDSGSGFEESSSYDLDLEKMILRTKDKDKGVAAEQKEEEKKDVAQQEDEEEGEDPAVDHVAATEEEDEGENDYDDDDDAASNYDSDDFDNITIKNESPGDKYEPASNYAGIEYDHHSMDSDNQYADPVCDDDEEEEHRPPPHNNNQHESDEYDRNRERSDDDDYDFDDDLDNDRRYGDDEDDDFDIHSGQDDDDAYALRVVQNVLTEEYGEEFYDRDGYEGHNNNNHHEQDDFDGSIIAQPNNYDLLSYGDDYDSSNAYPNNQLSNADDFDTNIAQPHNQLSYAEDFDSSIAQPNDETHYTDEFDSSTLQLQHNDRSSYASDDFDNLSSKSKEGLDKGLEDDVSGTVAADRRRRRYQDEEEGVYVASSSDGEADNLKADNISTDGEVGMDDVGMGLSSEGEEDAVPGQLRPGDGLSALERVQKEFEEGGEDDDDTEYLIDFD